MELTFGEQIKILLNRENRTIKEFAELVEARTGIHCSRQNLTQKLKRDNFQEQDMRALAAILGYKVQISLKPASLEEIADELAILSPLKTDFSSESLDEDSVPDSLLSPDNLKLRQTPEDASPLNSEEWPLPDHDREDLSSDGSGQSYRSEDTRPKSGSQASLQNPLPDDTSAINDRTKSPQKATLMETTRSVTAGLLKKPSQQQKATGPSSPAPDLSPDSINPYSGGEYLANTVRKHPTLDRYIQVYDQTEHAWVDVAEDYFQKFQEQKRQLMGKDYTQPIYI